MRKLNGLLIGLFIAASTFAQNNDPAILTIEGEDVYASEFMYIYSKNNSNPSFQKDSLDDYMELFINYKLKVKEAKDLKYDTIPSLAKELAQYRKQLSLPYMIDKDKNEALISEAYARTTEEVRASHILIRVNQNASPTDTNAAYVKAMQLRARVLKGESFEDVARASSEDPSAASNGGDLGYFSALQMVYPFEDAAFKTNTGDVSMPVRTRFGYHLIYVADKREARGTMEAAHILILANDKSSDVDRAKAEQKINEIYDLLKAGERFEDLAAKYSDDQSSKSKGGLLPIFGSGSKQRMVPEFENVAFSLTEDGQYSEPFKTTYGYHIIKRIQAIATPTYEKMYRELKLKVERDMRAETTKASFIEGLKKQYSFQDNSEELLPLFYAGINEDIFMAKWKGLEDRTNVRKVLFSFKNEKFTIADFESFIVNSQAKMGRQDIEVFVNNKYNAFVNGKITEYEDSQLETKYPEFKSLIQEYGDGILVFEIMQDKIWKKASKDSAGIRNYYEANKADFTYPVRYKGDLYKCKDKKTAKTVYKTIKTGKLTPEEIEKTMNKDSQLNVQEKTQTFSSKTTDAFKIVKKNGKVKMKTFKPGLNKTYKNGDSYYVINVEEVLEPRGREFSEAKGLVTAAYQNQLEKEWLESLHKKYEIKIHEDVLYNLGN